jgi:hypothetical protein
MAFAMALRAPWNADETQYRMQYGCPEYLANGRVRSTLHRTAMSMQPATPADLAEFWSTPDFGNRRAGQAIGRHTALSAKHARRAA